MLFSINGNASRLFFILVTTGQVIEINNSYEFLRISLVLNILLIFKNRTTMLIYS